MRRRDDKQKRFIQLFIYIQLATKKKMENKFTTEDFLIKIIPGGILLGVLYFLYGIKLNIKILKELDIFVTTIFFMFALLTGEIIQTIAHEFEWLIDIFYKFYRPSEIFYTRITLY